MSEVISQQNGVRSRKPKWCCLCGEKIEVGELKDVRKGVDCGDFWTMHMHQECHAYEQKKGAVDHEWYDDIYDPAFNRGDAISHARKPLTPGER